MKEMEKKSNMKNLLYKEFRIATPFQTALFLFFGIMILIPGWPVEIFVIYVLNGCFPLFMINREYNDTFFTATLPVRKKDIVKSKVLYLYLLQLISVVFAAPFALLAKYLYYGNSDVSIVNTAMMDPNFSSFGIIFIMLAVFDLIFIPWFYKTNQKIFWPVIIAEIVSCASAVLFESLAMIVPEINALFNGFESSTMFYRLGFLGLGILLYLVSYFVVSRWSMKRFIKIDI